jgi:hypothetical protein
MDDPNDPQNVCLAQISRYEGTSRSRFAQMQWSDAQKHLQLFIITLAAVVPDFESAIGRLLGS